MKKQYVFFLVFACFLSNIAFGQVDSSDYRRSEKRMMKEEKRKIKQEKKVKRMNAKMEKSQKRLNRQNRKLNKANRQTNQEMRDMEKQLQKMEETRKDSIPNTSYRSAIHDNKLPKKASVNTKASANTKAYWPYYKRIEC